MSKIKFTHEGTWWFDPETGEYEYDGPSNLIHAHLENVTKYTGMQTADLQGINGYPGEMWEPLSPEERKEKVLNYLSRIDEVDIHDRKSTQSN